MSSRLIAIFLFGFLSILAPGRSNYLQGSTETGPKVLVSKAPIYPAVAYALHASGAVVMDTNVTSDGVVSNVAFISGPLILRPVSREAALGWRFERSSKTEERHVRLTFDFVPDPACMAALSVSPYYLRVAYDPPETVNDIPTDAGTHCKVHHDRLARDKVEIVYGLVIFKNGYSEAASKLFPNAHSVVYGGCVVDLLNCDGKEKYISPKYAEVLYCVRCRKAEAEWWRRHQNTPFGS